MFFILQKDDSYIDNDIDLLVLKQELNKQKFQHQYIYCSLNELSNIKIPNNINIKECIPIGSLDFVQKYLSLFHNINFMSPIEVPNEMRLNEFLNRKYSIITKQELLNKKGYYFTKYAGKLKDFSHLGLVEQLLYTDDDNTSFLKDGLYVFSEVKNILSEYRVFVLNDKIQGIQFYDGDPTIMPTPDEIVKIKQMILRYMTNNKRPGAYSLDIAIISSSTNTGRDIMVIECHPFVSLGLYGLNGSFLPLAYRLGIDWYIKHNTSLEKFSNFNF